MPLLEGVPCPPGEDYDHVHSTISALTSLSAMISSFDAVMDTLEKKTVKESRRLDKLVKRCDNVKRKVNRIKKFCGERYQPIVIESRCSYPRNSPLDSITNSRHVSENEDAMRKDQNIFNLAREKSNKAILQVLRSEWEKDDGLAKMSDFWLDRASGFDEDSLCETANRLHTVPTLASGSIVFDKEVNKWSGSSVEEGRLFYSLLKKSNGSINSDSNKLADIIEPPEIEKLNLHTSVSHWDRIENKDPDDTSIMTESTTFSHKTSSSRSGSSKNKKRHEGKKNVFEPASSPSLRASTGSLPFLCELFHDSYGVGQKPPSNEHGSYFCAPNTVDELFIRNSESQCYIRNMSATCEKILLDNMDSSKLTSFAVKEKNELGLDEVNILE